MGPKGWFRRELFRTAQRPQGSPKERCVGTALILAAIIGGLVAAYNLNEFEQRQLVEWTPKAEDFLKHDDAS